MERPNFASLSDSNSRYFFNGPDFSGPTFEREAIPIPSKKISYPVTPYTLRLRSDFLPGESPRFAVSSYPVGFVGDLPYSIALPLFERFRAEVPLSGLEATGPGGAGEIVDRILFELEAGRNFEYSTVISDRKEGAVLVVLRFYDLDRYGEKVDVQTRSREFPSRAEAEAALGELSAERSRGGEYAFRPNLESLSGYLGFGRKAL